MKIKLNVLMILTLVVSLAFTSTGASASPGEFTINIGPDPLTEAAYQTPYSQQLTADGGTGPYSFSLYSGTLPSGITLSESGLLSGYPNGTGAIPGTYEITIDVQDSVGGMGSRIYNLLLNKGTPVIAIGAQDPIYWGNTFNISAQARMYDTPNSYSLIDGTAAFTIDGIPVPGCEAVIPDYQFTCPVSVDLSPGEHTFVANYTPLASNEHLYNAVLSEAGTFTITPNEYSVAGTLFMDNNQDGIWDQDAGEYEMDGAWTVNLDQGCDGTADYTGTTDIWSSYQFFNIPGPYCYRITVVNQPGFQQTTSLEDFRLTGDFLSQNIGFYTTTIPVEISISPETLPAAAYETPYSQQLTAAGGTEPYTFTLVSGTLPYGITLSSDGLLEGFPDYTSLAMPGTYPVTIQVQDANSLIASRNYDFVLDKGTPTVNLYPSTNVYWNRPFNLYAEVVMPMGEYNTLLQGTVAFFIDGTPVPGCDAVPYVNYGYLCEVSTMLLDVGEHTVEAAYTPTEWYADYYTSASTSSSFTVQTSYYYILGSLFRDSNQDGVWDYDNELTLGGEITINLDQGCDETVDYTVGLDSYWGYYQFPSVPGGFTYCLTVDAPPGYVQTTLVEPFYLNAYIDSLNVGFYYPIITIDPDDIPVANIGVAYSQTFTASGGTEPYTFSIIESTLPEGLTLSEAGVLSGTPTAAGSYYFTVQAQDATQAVGNNYYLLDIKTDGTFTFTSSANPSAPGDPVTFTITASGDAIHGYFGPTPPLGTITFFADGTAIEGCSDMFLNLAFDEFGDPVPADHPAVCTTAALGIGAHQITADFYDWTYLYNTPSLTLTQEVQVTASSDLSIGLTDSKDPVKPGAKMVYTIKVSNAGPDPAQDVIVVDTLDRNTTYISTSAPKGWKCTYANSKVTCTSASLASGATAYIKISVIVKKSAPVGKDLVNNAEVTSLTFDPDLLNNSVVQKTRVVK